MSVAHRLTAFHVADGLKVSRTGPFEDGRKPCLLVCASQTNNLNCEFLSTLSIGTLLSLPYEVLDFGRVLVAPATQKSKAERQQHWVPNLSLGGWPLS